MDKVNVVFCVLRGRAGSQLSSPMQACAEVATSREASEERSAAVKKLLGNKISDDNGLPTDMAVGEFLEMLGITGVDFVTAQMPLSDISRNILVPRLVLS